MKEVWYFGLQYVDNKGVTSWLRMNKKVLFYTSILRNRFIVRVMFLVGVVSSKNDNIAQRFVLEK